VEEAGEDEDSDEESEDEFDITDSSPEAAVKASKNHQETDQKSDGKETSKHHQTLEPMMSNHKEKTPQAHQQPPHKGHFSARQTRYHSRSRSTGSSSRFELQSPARFASPRPHLPQRHTEFATPRGASPSGSESSIDSFSHHDSTRHGAIEDIYSPKSALSSGKSRVSKDGEFIKTPTPNDSGHGRRSHSHTRSSSIEHYPRAFAVWGQDESDSNASESDADL
jgi:NAD+ kinase